MCYQLKSTGVKSAAAVAVFLKDPAVGPQKDLHRFQYQRHMPVGKSSCTRQSMLCFLVKMSIFFNSNCCITNLKITFKNAIKILNLYKLARTLYVQSLLSSKGMNPACLTLGLHLRDSSPSWLFPLKTLNACEVIWGCFHMQGLKSHKPCHLSPLVTT